MGAEFHYAVEGRWPFPLDMLRRDRSRAATPEDQRKIDLLSREIADLGDTAEERRLFRGSSVIIDLVIPNAGRHERPLTARWESFGWSVPNDPERARQRVEAAQTARLEAAHRSAMAKLTPDEKEAVQWAVLRELV